MYGKSPGKPTGMRPRIRTRTWNRNMSRQCAVPAYPQGRCVPRPCRTEDATFRATRKPLREADVASRRPWPSGCYTRSHLLAALHARKMPAVAGASRCASRDRYPTNASDASTSHTLKTPSATPSTAPPLSSAPKGCRPGTRDRCATVVRVRLPVAATQASAARSGPTVSSVIRSMDS